MSYKKLLKYKAKRNLKKSGEPLPKAKNKKGQERIFVIQEHHARSLHYDLRLEVDGVLKSWAIPKRPSSNSQVKRLAIMVEDHPYAYKDFEGEIPSGYGKGTVKIWDHGTYQNEREVKEGLKKGKIHIELEGEKLKGVFLLIRLNQSEKNEWLFMKKKLEPKKTDKGSTTNLDKVYWPKENITKGDLLEYYEKISPWILPYLKDRPESLRRFPNGIEGESFFQKNLTQHPDWIETEEIEHKDKTVNYLLIQDLQSLIYAANLGCIEFHPFFSRIQKLQNPDYMVFDLDPKKASFEKVVEVAQTIHEFLEGIGVPSYCKTSGATGLHIAIPLGAKYSYDQVVRFAELVATTIQHKIPAISTLERSISKRKGKIYIDYLQNHFGQTMAVAYSVRARSGAPVSTPLQWKEVKKGLDPNKFTIKTIFKRLEKWGDLFLPVLGKGIPLENVLKKMLQEA